MRTQKKGRIAFAVCGSFCTLEAALAAAQQLTEQGWELLPIMSFAAKQDTRFGTGQFWQERLEALTGHTVLDTLQAVEPLGPKKLASALAIAPCTGATLARLAAGLSDTPVTLAQKPFAGGMPGGGGRFHKRRAGRVGGEHRSTFPTQALLFCALRAG